MSDEEKKQNWMDGNTAAYRDILLKCAVHLDAQDPLREAAKWIAERRDTIEALRQLCERYQILDNWRDGQQPELHLADVIKNLEEELADVIE